MQIVVTSHTKDRKLYVDAIPVGTVLQVAFETEHWWVIDTKQSGLSVDRELPFIWIPKRNAVENGAPSHAVSYAAAN